VNGGGARMGLTGGGREGEREKEKKKEKKEDRHEREGGGP